MSTNSSYYGYFLHLVKQNGIEKQIRKKIKKRLRKDLKVMISSENDEVFPHFGRAPHYTFLNIEPPTKTDLYLESVCIVKHLLFL